VPFYWAVIVDSGQTVSEAPQAGLPDLVCFQTKNPNLGKFWRALEMKNVVIFYDRSEYFMAIRHNVWQFGRYSLWSFGIFFAFWYVGTQKNLATMRSSRREISISWKCFLMWSHVQIVGLSFIRSTDFNKKNRKLKILVGPNKSYL
jgi:hypothetical protein